MVSIDYEAPECFDQCECDGYHECQLEKNEDITNG